MKPADEDLFKPLSAKVGRTEYASGGKQKDPAYKRCGDGRKWDTFLKRRAEDRARRKAGRS